MPATVSTEFLQSSNDSAKVLGYSVTRGVAGVDETHLTTGLQKQKMGFFVEVKENGTHHDR